MIHPAQYAILEHTSWLILLCPIYSFYRAYYDITAITFIVFLTSINHWRYPIYNSWRRYADICAVNSALVYMILRAWNAEYGYIYYGSNVLGAYFYIQGWNYQLKNTLWNATYMHACMHICVIIGHLILYSGHMNT
jgi:hypothetical protein